MITRSFAALLPVVALVLAPGSHALRADETPPAAPPLAAVAPTWDAGRVEAGTQLRHTYELRNRGDRPLQILVTASCGCTTTEYDHEIAAGGVGTVTALVDTSRLRGRSQKTLSVTTNDPAQPAVILTIASDVQRALLLEPDDMPYLRGPAATMKPVELTVRTPDDAPFTITGVEDEPAMRAAFAPLDAGGPNGHRRYRLTLTPGKDLPAGTHHPVVTLHTTAPHGERFVVRPTLVVAGPLVAKPKVLGFFNAATPAYVRITAADGSAFHLLKAVSSDPDFVVEMAAVAGEPAWNVTARYVGPPTRRGPIHALVRITTDAPGQPTLDVPIAGKL
jgi:hypothetical protein